MPTVDDYYHAIQDNLRGQTPALRAIPPERLDWSGPGAVLELYEAASGQDRDNLIEALGKIIEEAKAPPAVLAQVVHLASSLDITQVEPRVRKLQRKRVAAAEPVQSAVINYFAFRQVQRRPQPAAPQPPAGRSKSP
jgi:hypothetical protein